MFCGKTSRTVPTMAPKEVLLPLDLLLLLNGSAIYSRGKVFNFINCFKRWINIISIIAIIMVTLLWIAVSIMGIETETDNNSISLKFLAFACQIYQIAVIVII